MALNKDEQISSDMYLADSQQRIADATIAEILKGNPRDAEQADRVDCALMGNMPL